MVRNLVRVCKNALLPKGKHFRKLKFGPASGCVMNIDFQHHTGLYLGIYEKEVETHIRTLLHRGYKCFDVGGQGGYDALIMAKLTGEKVVSFECDSDAAAEMRQTFALNTFPIQTVEAFVGNQNDSGHVSLDVVASEAFVPDFIKIDIEGAEVEALLGAENILSTRKPNLIVEVHGVAEERQCLDILSTHGYTPIIINRRTWLKEHRPLEHNRWLVCQGREQGLTIASQRKSERGNPTIVVAIAIGCISLMLGAILGAIWKKRL